MLQHAKLCREGITEENKIFYQSLNKPVVPTQILGVVVNGGKGIEYSTKVSRFVREEFFHQATFQNPLGKPVDLDFVVAEGYRLHPDLEEDQTNRGVKKEAQIEKWKEMLGMVTSRAGLTAADIINGPAQV